MTTTYQSQQPQIVLNNLTGMTLAGWIHTDLQPKTPVIRSDGQSHVQMHLMACRQWSQDLDPLIAWLRDNHTSPWSHSGPFYSLRTDFDVSEAQQLVEQVRDYYTLRWAHAKMTQGGTISPWRQTIIRCLNGQVHQDEDEGAVASLYWLYHADTVRDDLQQQAQIEALPGDPRHHDLRLRALQRSVRFGRRHGATKWMVDYWWLDHEDRLILWPVRQNDQGLAFLDYFWKQSKRAGTELEATAHCHPVRDWTLGPVTTVLGAELKSLP